MGVVVSYSHMVSLATILCASGVRRVTGDRRPCLIVSQTLNKVPQDLRSETHNTGSSRALGLGIIQYGVKYKLLMPG